MTSAAARVDALTSGVRELAMLASLTRRIEPQMLRALRLALAPHCRAADEADLWFSPIIETAAVTGLVFDPDVRPVLQRRLAEDPLRRMDAAWHLMFRMRAGVPFEERDRATFSTWLMVHEELTWWAVRGGPSTTEDTARIDRLFAWIRNSLANEAMSDDAAIWMSSAESLLPRQVWTLPGAAKLKEAAVSLNRQRAFWVRCVEGGIEMSEQLLDDAHRIDTSTQPGPLRVDVVPHGDIEAQSHSVLIDGSVSFLPSTARSVDLHLSDGRVLALDVEEHEVPSASETARLRSVVALSAGRTRWTGLLLSPRYALTFARAAKDGKVTVWLNDSFKAGGELNAELTPSSVRGEVIEGGAMGGPLAGSEALAIIRLERPIDGAGVGDIPVVGSPEPVVGRKVSIDVATTSNAESVRLASQRVSGVVTGMNDRGYTIRLDPAIDRSVHARAGGAPVWLETGELLGVLMRLRETFDAGVSAVAAPVRSVQSLLGSVRRRVLVAGTGQRELPDPVWRVGQPLGRALADAGHFLVCGGWPGVDYVVAQSFTESLRPHDAPESRIVQLVEEGWSPELRLAVPPIILNRGDWAGQMVAWADAVVALGGVGGVHALCEAAIRTGCPVLPIPGTGHDARAFYASLMSGLRQQVFPDCRALRLLEGETGAQEDADRMASRIVKLLEDCFDDASIGWYRESAAVLYGLIEARSDEKFALTDETDTFMRELREAAGNTPFPSSESEALARLRSILPMAARWLIADLVQLDKLATSASLQRARDALRDAILADKTAAEQLSNALVDENPDAEIVDQARPTWLPPSGRKTQSVVNFIKLLEKDQRARLALNALLALAREYLGPVDMNTFGETYKKLRPMVLKFLPGIDRELAMKLVTSRDAARRVVGYTIFLAKPEAALMPTLSEALEIERRTAFTAHETRPLRLLLICLSTLLYEASLAHQLSPEIDDQLAELHHALEGSKDVDPGRECTVLLGEIIERVKLSRTTECFSTYSRRISGPNEHDRYAWCVFIDAPRARLDTIAEVEYRLNSSFEDPVRSITDASVCFALLSESWHGFKLNINITYKSGRRTSQSYPLELKADAWPLGLAFSGLRNEPSTRVYTVLVDFRWYWRTESALRREAGLDDLELRVVLDSLARANHVRKSHFRSGKGEAMWGATARVGLLPAPTGSGLASVA